MLRAGPVPEGQQAGNAGLKWRARDVTLLGSVASWRRAVLSRPARLRGLCCSAAGDAEADACASVMRREGQRQAVLRRRAADLPIMMRFSAPGCVPEQLEAVDAKLKRRLDQCADADGVAWAEAERGQPMHGSEQMRGWGVMWLGMRIRLR